MTILGMKTFVLALCFAALVLADSSDKDKEECTNELVGLATCLPYVSGDAKSPTPDCCSGLKQVLKASAKCLCLIVKDRNDPDLGLNINVSLALSLPSVCNSPANISKCPELLHMDPNSAEAQIFYQFEKGQGNSVGMSPALAPGSSSPSPPSGISGNSKSDGGWSPKKRWGLEVFTVGALLWYVTTSNFGFNNVRI